MRVAVVGGGIAGLAAAWELSGTAGARAEVTVYEPGQLGGSCGPRRSWAGRWTRALTRC